MSTSTLGLFLRHLALSEEVSRLGTASDHDLLAAYESGRGQAAFTELMRRYGPMVLRTCRRVLGRGPDAEDAFQATFVLLAHKAAQLRRTARRLSLGGWLHRVAYHTALKVLVRAARRRVHERQASALTHADPDPSTEATWNEIRPILDAELDALPAQARQLLIACYLQGKTHAEAATELGLSLGSLARHLERARTLLATRLARRGITVSSALLGVLLGELASGAGVPAVLLVHTLEAAMTFGEQASGVLSAHVASLVKGALESMGKFSTKFSIVLTCCLTCCLGLAGAALVACRALSARPDELAAAGPTAPQATERPGKGGEKQTRTDRYGDPLPPGALARLGTLRLRHLGEDKEAGSVVFSRDGKVLITVGTGNPIRLWEAATGKLLRSFGESHPRIAVSIVPSPDGRTLAARNNNGTISLWEIATGKLLGQLGVNIDALAFSRDGRMLLTLGRKYYGPGRFESNHILVREVATDKEVRDQPLLNMEKIDSFSPNRVLHSVFSPDGKTLASIHKPKKNHIVRLWETATGKELCHLLVGEGAIPPGAVAFSPDSRFLAVSNVTDPKRKVNHRIDGAVHLWEVATGKEVRKWTPDKAETWSVAFSPDGKVLATGSGFGPIRFWEVATGKELRQCQDYRGRVVALAFSPDGSTLASLAGLHDHTVRLWEVASGKELVRASGGHVGPVSSVSFSPDGKSLISAGMDGLVGLWNAETGQERHPSLRAGDFQAFASLSTDGKTFVSVGNIFSPKGQSQEEVVFKSPAPVCVWDTATGQKLREFQAPAGLTRSLALSPDGKFLVLDYWIRIYLIEVATGKVMRYFEPPQGLGQWYATLSPDGKTLAVYLGTGADTHEVHFYAIATGKDLGSIKTQSHVRCLAFSPDEHMLAVEGVEDSPKGFHRTVRLWRVRADKKGWIGAGTLVGNQDGICGLMFSPDGKTLASACTDGTLRLWEVATGKERCRFIGHCREVRCVAFAPDGRRLATGGNDTTILVWDVTGRMQDGQLRSVKLSDREVKSLWADLASVDAARAAQAVWTLTASPAQALPFLREHLRPVAPAGPGIARFIADLDSDTFAVRRKAADELTKLGEVAEPALRQALAKPASVDMRRRLEQLLEPLKEKFPLSGEQLRSCRALEVLGQIGTPEALALLEALARGAPEARLTLEAQAILKHLGTRVKATKP